MKKIPTEQITGEKKPVYSIYELLGMKVNPYRHKNIEEYRAFLDGLTFADLQDHAVNEAGTIPYDSREKLTRHLEAQFLNVTGQIQANAIQSEEAVKQQAEGKKKPTQSKAKQKQLNELLSRGR